MEYITGDALFAAVPFWDSLGVSFSNGGTFSVTEALLWAKGEDEELCETLYDKYWDHSLAFTLDVKELLLQNSELEEEVSL